MATENTNTNNTVVDGEAKEVNSQPVEESNTGNTAAPAGEQPNNNAAEEPKKKRKMPKWLKVTLTHLGAGAIGAGLTALAYHFFGKDGSDAVQSVTQQAVQQPTLTSTPQQAIGQAVVETAKTVSEAVTQNQ